MKYALIVVDSGVYKEKLYVELRLSLIRVGVLVTGNPVLVLQATAIAVS